jgi:hypothetical protein
MKHIFAQNDYGEKETFERWNGKFYDEKDLDEIIHVTEDTAIYRPDATLDGVGIPIAYVITDAVNDKNIEEVLYSVEDSSVMRANCAGPILPEEMLKKGLEEGKDYKLRSPNSYHLKTKSGKWGMIAYSNSIDSVMVGSKRGRFTGKVNISNPELFEKLKNLPNYVEAAFKKANPEIYQRQRAFAEEYIPEDYRHGMVTTFSLNRYSAFQSKAMSCHSDGADVEYTTMSCHRRGEYTGAYLSFPRWGIGIDLPHGSVAIADSKSIHSVTPIHGGTGSRYTTVCYTDKSTAVKLKSERFIGKHAQKESGNLEGFFS